MRAAIPVAFLVLSLNVSACAEPFTPADLAGSYTLAGEDGQSLPRLLSATIECDLFLVGGALRLQADQSFVLDLAEQIDCSRSGGPVQDAGRTYPGTFVLRGHDIDFTSPRFGQAPITFHGAELGGIVAIEIVDADISAWGHLKPVFETDRRTQR